MRIKYSINLVAFVLLLGAATAGRAQVKESASMFRGGPLHTGATDQPGADRFGGYAWRFDAGSAMRSSPVVSGEHIYIGSADGRLHCLDHDGKEVWKVDLGAAVASSPAIASGIVVAQTASGRIVAVRAHDGSRVWSVSTGPLLPLAWGLESGDYYVSSPAITGAQVVVGSGDGALRALDLHTGHEMWKAQTGGRIRSSPAVADGRVIVGSFDGTVYAVDLATGRNLWHFDTLGHGLNSADFGFDRKSIQSSPAIADGTVYIGARDGFLYALDLASGSVRWKADHQQSWVITSPVVSGGVVYAGSSDAAFVQALDAHDGHELWRQSTPGIVWASPVLANGVLYVTTVSGVLRALNATDGTKRYGVLLDGDVRSTPAVMGDRLIVATEAGSIFALQGAAVDLRRIVYFDAALSKAGWYDDASSLASQLRRAGFELMDAAALTKFIDTRSAGTESGRSVVVFALDALPVTPGQSDAALLRRYLDTGGDAVWLGLPPGIWRRSPDTGAILGGYASIDRKSVSASLNVDFDHTSFDRWESTATQAGNEWGLKGRWPSSWAAETNSVDEVLARDENGRATAWIKRYPGGGSLRMIGRGGPPLPPEIVKFAAEKLLVQPNVGNR